MSNEDYRGLSRAQLELQCDILKIEKRAEMQKVEDIKNLVIHRVAAIEATTEPDARALPAPASVPVAGGSGRLVQAPALPGPSVTRSAPGSADDKPSNTSVYRGRDGEQRGSACDREPGMERSAHPRTRAYAGKPITHNTARSSLAGTSTQNAAGGRYSGTSNARASAPAQVSAPLHAGNRFRSGDARDSLLRVHHPMEISSEDHKFADETPAITERSFSALFGGDPHNERPQSKEWNILCVNGSAQPYVPQSLGDPGLVLVYPDVAVLEDICDNFHLFLNLDPSLPRCQWQIRYLGTYAKVPIVHATVEREEWLSLPPKCRKNWLSRIHSSTRIAVREAHARISLRKRNQGGSPPSTDAIRQWLEQNPKRRQGIKQSDIKAAFDSGEEKIEFEVIKYVRYDRGIATLLREDGKSNVAHHL